MSRIIKVLYVLGLASIASAGAAQVAVDGELFARLTAISPLDSVPPDPGIDVGTHLMPVTGGSIITGSFWARSLSVLPTSFQNVSIYFFEGQNPDGSGNTPILPDTELVGTEVVPLEWHFYSRSIDVPVNANFCGIRFQIDSDDRRWYDTGIAIDNVKLVQSGAAPTDLPLLNGSFEDWPGAANELPTGWRYFEGHSTGTVLRGDNPPSADSAAVTLSTIFKQDSDVNSWFLSDENTRGMTYNPATDHLLVVDRDNDAVGTIRVLDPNTGNEISQLNTSGIDPTDATFVVNKITVDRLGAIYVCNLARDNETFRVYRYENETAALSSGPSLVYSETPVPGGRMGDDIDSANEQMIVCGRGSSKILLLQYEPGIPDLVPGAHNVSGMTGPVNVSCLNYTMYIWHRSLGFSNESQIPDFQNVSSAFYTADSWEGTYVGNTPSEINTPHSTGPFDVDQYIDLLAIAPAEAEYTTATVDVAGYGYRFQYGQTPPHADVLFKTGGLEKTGGWMPNGNGSGDVYIDNVGNRVFYLVTGNSISAWEIPDLSNVNQWMLY